MVEAAQDRWFQLLYPSFLCHGCRFLVTLLHVRQENIVMKSLRYSSKLIVMGRHCKKYNDLNLALHVDCPRAHNIEQRC